MVSPPNPDAAQDRAVIIRPPSLPLRGNSPPTLFLAGPTSSKHSPDWRARLCTSLADLPVQILDPKNTAWDSTWHEDSSDSRWAAQVEWEMTTRATADVVVFFFEAGSDAPISLLELGLSLGAQKSNVRVFAMRDYSKRGYVRAACEGFRVSVEDNEVAFFKVIRSTISALLK